MGGGVGPHPGTACAKAQRQGEQHAFEDMHVGHRHCDWAWGEESQASPACALCSDSGASDGLVQESRGGRHLPRMWRRQGRGRGPPGDSCTAPARDDESSTSGLGDGVSGFVGQRRERFGARGPAALSWFPLGKRIPHSEAFRVLRGYPLHPPSHAARLVGVGHLEPDQLGSNPSSPTASLCDLKQMI